MWSLGTEDEEIRNPTHGTMFTSFEEDDEEKVTRKCFVSTYTQNFAMTSQVRSLLKYFNIPSSAYDSMLSEFDRAITYINDLLFLVVVIRKSSINNY